MKYKSTLLLLIAVVIAGLAAYSLSKRPTSDEAARQRKRLLPDFHAADVKRLTIQSGSERIVCRRDGPDEWRILEPVDVRADRWQVEGILDKLETAEKVSSIYPDSGERLDLEQYGLKEPARTVTVSLSDSGAPAWTLKVGKPAGAAGSAFVAVEGREGVFAVKKDVTDKTDATVMSLRSKALAPRISTFDLNEVALSGAALDDWPALEVECRKTDDRWEITRPVRDPADRSAVEALANTLYDHRIAEDDFVSDDPARAADYGLEDPLLTVMLAGRDKTQAIAFSRRQEGEEVRFYALARGEPTVVTVPETLFQSLRKEPDDLRDRSLADFQVANVEEVVVAGASGELVLKKRDGAWEIDGAPPTQADRGAVEGLLRELKDLRVESFPDDEPTDLPQYGLDEGQSTVVTLKNRGGDELAALSLGRLAPEGDAVYARRSAYPAVLALPKGSYYDQMTRGRLAFLDRLVLDEPQAEAIELALERGRERLQCVWRREQAAWEVVKPVTGPTDRSAVQRLLGALAPLRALAFAAEQADDVAPFGLAQPQITLHVTYQAERPADTETGEQPERRVRTLQVGGPAEEPAEGWFARLADDGRVFILPDSIVERLRANLASKEVCRTYELTGLTFEGGGQSVTVTYDRAEQTWNDPDGNPLDEAMREAVEGAATLLRDFRAADVADYVERGPGLYGFDEPFLVVTLDEETTRGRRVVIGSEREGGGRYVKGPETGFVHVASQADVARLAAVLAPAEPPAMQGPAPQ